VDKNVLGYVATSDLVLSLVAVEIMLVKGFTLSSVLDGMSPSCLADVDLSHTSTTHIDADSPTTRQGKTHIYSYAI